MEELVSLTETLSLNQNNNSVSSTNQYSVTQPSRTTATQYIRPNRKSSQQNTFAMGRWGEEYTLYWLSENVQQVSRFLKSNNSNASELNFIPQHGIIQWINAVSETQKPYDLVITDAEGKIVLYIEVKTTTWNEQFYLSNNEWGLTRMKQDKFVIARVTGAGQQNAEII